MTYNYFRTVLGVLPSIIVKNRCYEISFRNVFERFVAIELFPFLYI